MTKMREPTAFSGLPGPQKKTSSPWTRVTGTGQHNTMHHCRLTQLELTCNKCKADSERPSGKVNLNKLAAPAQAALQRARPILQR